MEQEMLNQILAMVTDIKDAQAKMQSEITEVKAQQIIDSGMIAGIFENSIDNTERITAHDHTFNAIQVALEIRDNRAESAAS